jgi:hypothetical protein
MSEPPDDFPQSKVSFAAREDPSFVLRFASRKFTVSISISTRPARVEMRLSEKARAIGVGLWADKESTSPWECPSASQRDATASQ